MIVDLHPFFRLQHRLSKNIHKLYRLLQIKREFEVRSDQQEEKDTMDDMPDIS